MKDVKKTQYEEAELEIVKLGEQDIISTSNPIAGGGDFDKGGWTGKKWF